MILNPIYIYLWEQNIALVCGDNRVIFFSGSNNFTNLDADIPGSIYTALMNNFLIGDPYYRDNDDKYRWISKDNWSFNRTFQGTDYSYAKTMFYQLLEADFMLIYIDCHIYCIVV